MQLVKKAYQFSLTNEVVSWKSHPIRLLCFDFYKWLKNNLTDMSCLNLNNLQPQVYFLPAKNIPLIDTSFSFHSHSDKQWWLRHLCWILFCFFSVFCVLFATMIGPWEQKSKSEIIRRSYYSILDWTEPTKIFFCIN